MGNIVSIVLFFLSSFLGSYALSGQNKEELVLGFYNLENLFDTVHDFRKKDYEYLPGNAKDWDSTKYYQKLNHLARSIASMNNWRGPDILGVCELENAYCLRDLLNETSLKGLGYSFIHKESNDERGIDVACLYKKTKVSLIESQFININLGHGERSTRDVLRAKFSLKNKDTIQFFVNHWPSRYGGEQKSSHKRVRVARLLKQQIDSLTRINPEEKIVLVGDFNDSPVNESLEEVLMAKNDTNALLFNTSYSAHLSGLGSHKYQDEWNLFDQIIVSKSLLSVNRTQYASRSFKIHNDRDWLSETDLIYGGQKPFRSFYGKTYISGYSDHYAVSIRLKL